ncbi:MAG: DEAD/DEAH box helicase [Cytophagales bacterium]
MKFEDYHIHPSIKKSLAELGFKRPTDIQFKAIPSIMNGEDVMAIAQTGTGKTAAFAIPIINHLLNHYSSHEGVRALVLAPTRELAVQIHGVFTSIAQYTDLQIIALVGGLDQETQISALQAGADIVIATPGRMFDLIYQGHVKITKTEILVLDESDQMLALGFMKDIQDVKKFLPKIHQTLFFSATINEEIKDLAYTLVRNPIRIQISPKNPVSKNVNHSVGMIAMDDKRFFLERIIKQNPESKIVVFVRTKVRAERVFKAMERVAIETVTIHGDKEQDDRFEAMKRFADGEVKVLIATDITARGIDIKKIEYVINYDIPDVAENYVHRVGRTGRGVEKGFAISFCSEEEIPLLKAIEEFVGGPITVLEIAKKDVQDTIDFSTEVKPDLKSLMKEIADYEAFKKSKKKKKK